MIQNHPRRSEREITLFEKHGSAGTNQHWRAQVFEKFGTHLAEKGLKPTHQRNLILTHLLDAQMHLTMDDIFAELKAKDPTLGRATVFRTLKLLEGCGIVDRVSKADGKPCFEIKLDRPHHDHAICIECGAIQEFRSEKMEVAQDEVVSKLGFSAIWHRHEVFGRCRSCRARHA